MRILIFNKKFLIFMCIIFFIIFSMYFYYHNPFSMAVELSINNGLNDNAKEKIMSLTKGTEKIAYLTFDDGPTLRATPKVLDILKEENVKALIFCNPHNPVGRVWTREEMEKVAEICLKYNVIWMVDEMHCDFIFPGHEFTSCMNLDKKFHEIIALYSSPGKTFNVAGLQPANIIIPNEELRKKYQWANTQAAYSQGSLMGQLAVKVCYTKGADWVDELVEYIYENVKYMSRYVKENFPKAKMVEPEGTYLVWVDFSGYGFSNEELEHLMLEEAKLWLDSGIIFGPETAQFERFNVACPRVTVEQALTQLKNALDKHLAEK